MLIFMWGPKSRFLVYTIYFFIYLPDMSIKRYERVWLSMSKAIVEMPIIDAVKYEVWSVIESNYSCYVPNENIALTNWPKDRMIDAYQDWISSYFVNDLPNEYVIPSWIEMELCFIIYVDISYNSIHHQTYV